MSGSALARRVLGAVGAGIVLVGLVGGCTQENGEDVASVETQASASGAASPNEDEAPATFVSCLVDAGLPAVMETMNDGKQHLMFDAQAFELEYPSPEGAGAGDGAAGGSADADSPIKEATHKAFGLANASGGRLAVDGVDRSQDFVGCLETTGYQPPTLTEDEKRDGELEYKQLTFDGGLAWAQCARDAGYPDIPDPLPVVYDDMKTMPWVYLPAEMEPKALESLLDQCPNFDCAATYQYQQDQTGEVPRPLEVNLLESGDSPGLFGVISADQDLFYRQYSDQATEEEACAGTHQAAANAAQPPPDSEN
ncbi:MAG: hypothetical protein LBH48_03800 [Bifidobacteriaceae bacterium]|jgi:hypothetical protein|nr:hypothetical protein [Bifidobacteriaceae bacterium]